MKARVSKLISMLCVVAMLVSALPVSAFAADEEHTHGAEAAYVGGTYLTNPDTQLKGEAGPMKAPALNAAAPKAANADYIHNFTTDGVVPNGIYTTISGNLATSKGTVTYNGLTLTQCLKIETDTKVSLNAPESGTLTLVFGGSTNATGKRVVVGGVKQTIGSESILKVNVSAGNVDITKADSINLFYIEFTGSCPGHEFTDATKVKVTKAPTCTATGEQVRLCIHCNAENTVKETVAALGHDWGAYATTRPATCVLEGEETHTCRRVGCGVTESRAIAKIAHDFTGSDTTHCSMCGVKQGVNLDTHTHNWGGWTDVAGKTANCTTAGEQTRQCPDCEMTETKIVPALGHNWSVWQTVSASTCTVKGSEKRTCSNPGCPTATETRELALAPHKVGADGVCSVCHQAIGNALTGAGGWLESMYVETTQFSAADVTDVSWVGPVSDSFGPGNRGQYDMDFLVRILNGKTRIDIPGLKAGTYTLTVTTSDGQRYTAEGVEVKAHDRSGYAHWNYTEGVGAYRDDGILKENAIVIYVNEQNKNTVELEIPGVVSVQGIGNILNSVGQDVGSGKTEKGGIPNSNKGILKLLADRDIPLVVRIVGDVKSTHPAPKDGGIDGLTAYDSLDYGGSVGDNGSMARMKNCKDITIEGIGPDACMNGWGIHFMATGAAPDYGKNLEVRNITFRNVPEDCIGMEGIQEGGKITAPILHGWVHNCSFYAPTISPAAESDKGEGDGACDFKRGEFFTMDYCYYEGYHKTNLVGSSDDSLQFNITWHHNHWKNCAARGPLGRNANMHIYNCIYENQSDYAMNTRANCYIVSEYNTFLSCKNPMQIKSGGGPIKSYNDVFSSCIEDMHGTIVDSMDTPVSSSNKNAGFELDKSKGYIASLDYKLDRSVGEARQNILANAGAMKTADKMVEPEDVATSIVPDDRMPTNPVALPYDKDINQTNAVAQGTKDNIVFHGNKVTTSLLEIGGNSDTVGKNVVFMTDKVTDIEITGTNITLCDGDGNTLGTSAQKCPPGIYFIQSATVQPPKGTTPGYFKSAKVNHLKITEVAGATTHTHSYTKDDGIVVNPTCIKEGSRKWSCSCGLFITKPIPMTEHADPNGDGLCDACGFNMNNIGPVDPDAPKVDVESVSVTPTSLTIQQGESARLVATVLPANATNKAVAWSSSNSAVASVGTSGYVTGNTPGTAVITVKASNNKTATVNVTVTGVSTKQYTFNAVDQGQQPKDSNPAAEGMKVGTENFFTVTGANAMWRVVGGKNNDMTTKSLQIGSKRSSGMSFTIPAGSTAREVTISFGSTSSTKISAVVLADAAGDRQVNAEGRTLSYITGTAGGKATYKNLPAGTYTIYAPKDVIPSEVGLDKFAGGADDVTDPNLRGTRIMTVSVVQATSTDSTYKPVTKVTLDKATLELEVGQQYTLTAALEPADASNTSLDWVSSVPTVARINGGTVRANTVGTTTIRATAASGKFAECVVNVKASTSAPVKVTKITILGADSVDTEDVITLVADVEPDDATNANVTWSVNDGNVAKINNEGVLTGLADGKVVVTATAQDGSGVKGQKVITVGKGVQAADKTGLENVINRAQTAIDRVSVAAKAEDVAKGTKWVSQADHDAFQAAIDAAQAVYDKKDATAAEISAATTTLSSAMTTFAGKAQDGTKDEGGTTPTPGDKEIVLDAATDLTTFAADSKSDGETQVVKEYFTIYYSAKTKVEDNSKKFEGYDGTRRINFGGSSEVKSSSVKNVIKFTTSDAAAVKVFWAQGGGEDSNGNVSDLRNVAIVKEDGTTQVDKSNDTSAKNAAVVSTLNITEAGTYYLVNLVGNNPIYRVEVKEASGDTPTPPTPSDVDRSKLDAALADAKKALEEATVSVDGSDIDHDKFWVTEADKAPLQSAITLAALAFTQEEVNEAVAELKTALAEFALAKKAGTKLDKPTDPENPDQPSGPSGGGGGGGGSSAPAISGTTLTVDGKKQTASTVGQLSDSQASALTSNAQKSGTDIEITVDASADATDVELNVSTKALKNMAAKTDVALEVKAPFGAARLPNASLADLGEEKGKAVNITVEKAENGVKVTVTVGGKVVDTLDGGVTAVTDANANGSVAYLVNDGKEELVKFSYVEEGRLYANMPGSGEIVVKDNTKTFRDVEDNWAKPAIDFAASRELFNGVNELDFAPSQDMTRAMLVTVLYRLEGAKSGAQNKFADVAADSWYTEAVAWANAEGIVSGKSETHFGPDDDITREQLATILYRYATKLRGMKEMGEDSEALEKFSDKAVVSDFAAEGMAWAVEQGVIGGRGDGTLAPGGFASRAEVATMLMRFVKAII